MNRPRIDYIRIITCEDSSPDLSWLGEYGNNYRPGAIDRKEANSSVDLREFRYFYPNLENYKGLSPRTQRRYALQEYRRMESYGRDWCMVGIWAEAAVSYPVNAAGDRSLNILRSESLWGIESNANRDYIDQIVRDELTSLKVHLEIFDVDTSDFDEKAANAEEVTQ